MNLSPGNPLGPSVEGGELNIASQAQGDILYYNGSTWIRLAAGTSGQFLKTQGAAANPLWASFTGGWILEADETTSGGPVSSVDFTGLDLETDHAYMIVGYLLNDVGTSGGDLRLFVNSDTTTTNYYRQEISRSATTMAGDRVNNPRIGNMASNPTNQLIVIFMSKISGQEPYAVAFNNPAAPASILWDSHFWVHNSTTNVTSISLASENANHISDGSRIALFKAGV